MTTGRINQVAFLVNAGAIERPWLTRGHGRAQTSTAIVRGRAMTLAWYIGRGGQRPQTHMIFCIQNHEYTYVVHIGNAKAARHAWDMRMASRSCRCPTRSVN